MMMMVAVRGTRLTGYRREGWFGGSVGDRVRGVDLVVRASAASEGHGHHRGKRRWP